MSEDFEILSIYTRADAIADGTLVDMTQGEIGDICRQYFKIPIACTSTVWGLFERTLEENPLTSLNALTHDVIWYAYSVVRNMRDKSQVVFSCNMGESQQQFKLHVGPGDAGEPVLTLMLPDED